MAPNPGKNASPEVIPTDAAPAKEAQPNRLDVAKKLGEGLGARADLMADELTKVIDKRRVKELSSMLDVGKNPVDFLRISANFNARPQEHFLNQINALTGVSREAIIINPAFRDDVGKLKDYAQNRMLRKKDPKEYSALCERVDLALVGYVKDKDEAKVLREGFVSVAKEMRYTTKVANLAASATATPEQKAVVEKYWKEKQENIEKFQKGEITKDEFNKKNDELNDQVAKDSGDKDLQKECEEHKANVADAPIAVEVKVTISPQPNDKPVENKSDIQQALSTVKSDNFHFDMHDGGASVLVGPEKFPMEVSVYKNDQTQEFVYYIADKHSENGYYRVDFGSLSGALDGRYLDSYLTEKIGQVADDNDNLNKIPDAMLVKFGKKLLGSGKSRGYKIEGENREVINAMVKVLEQPSEKYSTYYKKIEALSTYFEKEDNIAGLRRRLLEGDKISIDEV
ncbi:MAG: hypothetical protein NTZ25_03680 [Candidatus Peregrinibacteria bacterium]|nr:hypothetical protein [Candidatus Peregrinibacteria bacterium]